jgi:hypothetical protein
MLALALTKLGIYAPAIAAVIIAGAAGDGGSNSVSFNGGLIAEVIQFGFLGAVFIDVVGTHKFLVPKWTMDKAEEAHTKELALKDDIITGLKQDIVELKASNVGLQELTRERMIPALVQATDVSRAYVTELARENDARARPRRGSRAES